MKRIEVLDGLRGLAVLIVFLSHTSGRDQSIAGFLNFHGIGHIGVYLFFTLSAFLLGLGLFSKPLSSQNIKSFFIKRVLRIAPLYYIIVSGVFLVQIIYSNYSTKYLHVSNGLNGYLEHIYFYRGDGVFWSIVSEMQFYLIVPILGWILLKFKRKGIIILLLIAILNFALYLMKYAGINDYLLYVSPNTLQRGTFIDIFIPGLIMAYLVQSKMDFLKSNEKLIHKIANVSLIFGGILTVALVSKNFLGINQPLYHFRFLSMFFGTAFSIITLSLYIKNDFLNDLFKRKFLRFIGKIGFSFYLIHMAVFEIINKTDLHHTLKFLTSLTIILIVSSITII